MPPPNTLHSLHRDLFDLGLRADMTVMVHSSLGRVGWTVGGPVTVIRALLEVLGTAGTLVMPAESPHVSDPSTWNDPRVMPEWYETIRENLPVFDPLTTPTTMGAIAEAFRTFPGTQRSRHPLVSVCANGRHAEEITKHHALEFCEGKGTPFEKLYDLDAYTLLLGVGFERCSSLHYAESLVPNRRTTLSRFPIVQDGARVWVEKPDMAFDNGTHFQLSASNSAVHEQSVPGALVTQTPCSFRRAIWLILPNRISCAHWPPIDRLPHEGELAIVY